MLTGTCGSFTIAVGTPGDDVEDFSKSAEAVIYFGGEGNDWVFGGVDVDVIYGGDTDGGDTDGGDSGGGDSGGGDSEGGDSGTQNTPEDTGACGCSGGGATSAVGL